jgi:hypothetical protein
VTKTNLNGDLELVMLNEKAEQLYHGLETPFIEIM